MKTRKKILATVLCIGALGVFAPRGLMAQGTVYVSSTGYSTSAGDIIGNDFWGGSQFVTGTAATGYTLNSIQFLSGGAVNPGYDFSLWLYADNGGNPGTSLGVLSGTSNPVSYGTIYDYTASDITLFPSTAYWVVVKTEESASNDNYSWSLTYSDNYTPPRNGWSLGGSVSSSDGGDSWSSGSGVYIFQFGVTATPVPEPGTFALVGLGLSALFLRRKK